MSKKPTVASLLKIQRPAKDSSMIEVCTHDLNIAQSMAIRLIKEIDTVNNAVSVNDTVVRVSWKEVVSLASAKRLVTQALEAYVAFPHD